jgi:plastocyanin
VPAAIEVPVGASVTWRWEGKHDHNVYADAFESAIQKEGTFAHTFAEPGRYPYRCTLHGGMDGEVVVVAANGAAS